MFVHLASILKDDTFNRLRFERKEKHEKGNN